MEENNNNFSDDLKPSKEDIELRQRQLQTKRSTSAKSNPSSGSSGLVIVAFLVAFIATGVGGFALWKLMEVQDKLSQADAFLSKLDSATETLQESVSETGAKASLSAGALKSLVKENNAEIRKLWYISNERNKQAIEKNKKQLASYKKEVAEKQKVTTEAHEQEVATLKSAISQLETSLSDAQIALSEKIKKQQQAHTKLAAKTNKLKKSVSSLPEVELRMGQNEELLESLESQIKALDKQVKELKASNKP